MSDRKPTEAEINMAREIGLQHQPDPEPNDRPSSHDQVMVDLDTAAWVAPGTLRGQYDILLAVYMDLCGSRAEAMAEIYRRKEFGLAKYGTALQAFNGRDSIADARDEMGDLLVYYRTAIEEGEGYPLEPDE